jgi:hypothetical protein
VITTWSSSVVVSLLTGLDSSNVTGDTTTDDDQVVITYCPGKRKSAIFATSMIFIGQSKRGFASEAGKSTLTSYRGVPGQVRELRDKM